MFPEAFLKFLVVGSLAMTALAVVALLWLLFRDYVKGRLW